MDWKAKLRSRNLPTEAGRLLQLSYMTEVKAFNGYNYASRDAKYKIGKKNLDNS